MLVGLASDVGLRKVSRHPEERQATAKELEALLEGPVPEGYIYAAESDHRFTRWLAKYGMYQNTTIFASSEKQRRWEIILERRVEKMEMMSKRIQREALHMEKIQAKLARMQRVKLMALARNAASTVIGSRWRMVRARMQVMERRRKKAGRFLANFVAYRLTKRRRAKAATRIQLWFLRGRIQSIVRIKRRFLRAAIMLQTWLRGTRTRQIFLWKRSIAVTATSFIEKVLVFGFARAHQCLMCPHHATNIIQRKFRRHLRRRRAAERKMRRSLRPDLKRSAANHAAATKKIADAADIARRTTFPLPSIKAIHAYLSRAKLRIHAGDMANLVHISRYMDHVASQARFTDDPHDDVVLPTHRPPGSSSLSSRRPRRQGQHLATTLAAAGDHHHHHHHTADGDTTFVTTASSNHHHHKRTGGSSRPQHRDSSSETQHHPRVVPHRPSELQPSRSMTPRRRTTQLRGGADTSSRGFLNNEQQ